MLGSHRIDRLLGRGGMGAVFLAYDTMLHRHVALKVIDGANDDTSRARLLREARSAAALNHPNICTIHEVGHASGSAYIAMEFVEGRTLRDRLDEGPLPLDEAIKYAIQAADALAYAHDQGVIHRDFKAANAIITSTGRLKIVDFGLARREDAVVGNVTTSGSLLPAGTVAGTPYAMAPEQVRGAATDSRTDIWALGVLLYEMVSAARPFAAGTITEVFSSILRDDPRPLPPDVPVELRALIERCLDKEAERRYQRASEVVAALDAIQAGTGSPWIALRYQLGRRRWLAPAAALLVGAVVAGMTINQLRERWSGSPAQIPSIRLAVLPFANLSNDPEQEYFSDGLTDAIIADLAQVSALQVIARSSVMPYKGTEKSVREIAADLNVHAIVEGSAQRIGDAVRLTVGLTNPETGVHLWGNTYEPDVGDVLRVSREIAGTIARQVNVPLTADQERRLAGGRTVNPAVYEAYLRGIFFLSQGRPLVARGLEYLHRAVEIDPADPLAYAGLAEGYVTIGHSPTPPPPETFPRARAAAEQALKLDPNMAQGVAALASVALYYEWDWAKAEQYFKRALELNPSLAMTRFHYAWYLVLVDRMDEAIEEHKRARDLDPLAARHTAWLGGLYQIAGRHDEAITEARKAVELSPTFGPNYDVKFLAYSHKGMPQEALAAAQAGAGSGTRYSGPMLPAIALAKAGQRDAALNAFAQSSETNHWLATQFYSALGDKDEAFRQLEAGYQVRVPVLPWIRVRNFGFDDLRDDPRFADLVRRMNLPL